MSATAPAALRAPGRPGGRDRAATGIRRAGCAGSSAPGRRSPWSSGARRGVGVATLYPSRRTPTVATLSRRWIERCGPAPGFARVRWADRHRGAGDHAGCADRPPRPAALLQDRRRGLRGRGAARALPADPGALVRVCAGRDRGGAAAARALAALGPYRFNVTHGERRRWLWPDVAAGAARLDAWLAARRAGRALGRRLGPAGGPRRWLKLRRGGMAQVVRIAARDPPWPWSRRSPCCRCSGTCRSGSAELAPGAWLAVAGAEVTLLFALLALLPPLCAPAGRADGRRGVGIATMLVVALKAARSGHPREPGTAAQPAARPARSPRSLVDLLPETLGGVPGWLGLAGARPDPAPGASRPASPPCAGRSARSTSASPGARRRRWAWP